MITLIPILLLVLSFILRACQYLKDRFEIIATTSLRRIEETIETTRRLSDEFHDHWQSWLPREGEKQQRRHHRGDDDVERCRDLIVPLPEDDDDITCRRLMGPVCGPYAQRVKIPPGLDVFTRRGGKLEEGREYCTWKSPHGAVEGGGCDPQWGYLQFSPELDRWRCRSRLPGIYNADTDTFDACHPGGQLLLDDEAIVDYSSLSPSDLYDRGGERVRCRCPPGYVSRPSISRSTCFVDPCLTHLPRDVDAPGLREDGTCDCGDYYVNANDGDPRRPCTACPDPTLEGGRLNFWIECDGSYPCISQEDQIRGCTAGSVATKIMTPRRNEKFLERIVGGS